MADEKEDCPCSVMDKAKAWCLVIAAVGGLITSTIGAVAGILTHGKADNIETHQAINSTKIDAAATNAVEVKQALTEKATKTDAKLEDLKKAVAAVPATTVGEIKKDKQ